MAASPAMDRCPLYAQGYCWRSSTCPDPHTPTQTSHEPANPVLPADQRQPVSGDSGDSGDEPMCNICYDTPDGRMWGLLETCSHMFCLECIQQWRSLGVDKTDEHVRNARACPLCRTESSFVIPSAEFITNGPAKDVARAQHLALLSRTPCPDFLTSPSYARHCPLGTDCLYHHATSADLPAHEFLHSFADTLRERGLARERREIEAAFRREVERLELQRLIGPQMNVNEVRRLYEQFRMAIPAGLEPWAPPPGHDALAPPDAGPEADPSDSDEDESEFDESESGDEDWESENEHGDDEDEDDDAAPAPRAREPPPPPRPEVLNPMRRPIHPRARAQPPPPPPAPGVEPSDSDADDMPELEPIDSDGERAESPDEGMPQLEDIDASDDDDMPAGVYASDSDGLPPLETESSDESSDDDLPPPLVELEPPGIVAARADRVRDPEMEETRERAATAAEARVVVARWEDVD